MPSRTRCVVEMEVAAVERIALIDPALPVPVARAALDGSPIATAEVGGATHLVRLLPLLPGRTAEPADLDAEAIAHIGEVVARIGRALRGLFHPAAGRTIWWDQQHLPELARRVVARGGARSPRAHRSGPRPVRRATLSRRSLRSAPSSSTTTSRSTTCFSTTRNRVSGIIDFGDMAHTALVLDVPATLQSLVRGRTDLFEVAEAFLAGYTSVLPLEDAEAAPVGRPAGRADGADDPHLGLAHASAPGQRLHPRLGRARVGAARADGDDRLRRGRATHGGHRPRSDRATGADPTICWPAATASSAARSSRCRIGRRSTSSAATAPGWRRRTGVDTSTRTTTSRSSVTPIRGSWTRSLARRRR